MTGARPTYTYAALNRTQILSDVFKRLHHRTQWTQHCLLIFSSFNDLSAARQGGKATNARHYSRCPDQDQHQTHQKHKSGASQLEPTFSVLRYTRTQVTLVSLATTECFDIPHSYNHISTKRSYGKAVQHKNTFHEQQLGEIGSLYKHMCSNISIYKSRCTGAFKL